MAKDKPNETLNGPAPAGGLGHIDARAGAELASPSEVLAGRRALRSGRRPTERRPEMTGRERNMKAGRDDLRWWLDLAPTLEWIWAKTYADSAPHWYVVHGRTEGLTMDDFVRAGRVIRTFGEPGKFYRSTNLYLYTEGRTKKFWAMWGDAPRPEDADLINMAGTDHVYGPQDDINWGRVEAIRIPTD